jgi:2-polyprenyl-6-methoxyphenol hydroxylase-like FAD-dependent oxidoreductase
MRIFQRVGAAGSVEQSTVNLPEYRILGADGNVLINIDWNAPNPSGWRSDYVVYQPELEAALDAAVRRCPTVDVHQGWEAVGLAQEADHVASLAIPVAGSAQLPVRVHADAGRRSGADGGRGELLAVAAQVGAHP